MRHMKCVLRPESGQPGILQASECARKQSKATAKPQSPQHNRESAKAMLTHHKPFAPLPGGARQMSAAAA